MFMRRLFSRRHGFADAVALETQHLHHAVPHRPGEIELQRPVAVHFESNARPIGTLVQSSVATTGRTMCAPGIDGISAPTVSVRPDSGSLVRALASLMMQS